MKNKQEFCESQKTIAYCDKLNGIEIKNIEYGINDYIWCISNTLAENKDLRGYHHVKIHYEFSLGDESSEARPYIKIWSNKVYTKVYLDECIRSDLFYDEFR